LFARECTGISVGLSPIRTIPRRMNIWRNDNSMIEKIERFFDRA
jgi:hypothetical protein